MLVFFSCAATTGRPEHGTGRTSRADNPFLGDYYLNLTEQDFRDKCDLSKFEQYEFSTCDSPADLLLLGLMQAIVICSTGNVGLTVLVTVLEVYAPHIPVYISCNTLKCFGKHIKMIPNMVCLTW